MRFSSKLIVVAFSVLAISACSKSDVKKAEEAGKTTYALAEEGNSFVSTYFDITVTKPESWYAAPPEMLDQMFDMGGDVVAGEDDQMRRLLDASKKKTAPIAGFFKFEPGAPVESNPSVLAVAENLNFAPTVKTGVQYFEQMKTLMAQTNFPATYSPTYTTTMIDGQSFDTMEATINFPGITVLQTYHATRHGDHMIAFIESFSNEEERAETNAILDKVSLNW